jgi:endonuclease YncB( thermonuclease family)
VALSLPAWAGTPAEDLVVSVQDGDTLTVLAGKQQVKVRLAEIDTHELGQPFGNVECARMDANAHLVVTGMAWVPGPASAVTALHRPMVPMCVFRAQAK